MLRTNRPPHLVWLYVGSLAKSLDAATNLETSREMRKMGWKVTLIGAGPSGIQNIRGVDVFCIPKPRVYFIRQIVFHLNFLRLVLPKLPSIDVILFNQMSTPWVLFLKIVRRFYRLKHPVLVLDTRTLPMCHRDVERWNDRLRRAFYYLAHRMAHLWADGQTAITHLMAQIVKIPSHQLLGVWPSGVNIEKFNSAYENRQWPMENDPIKLIYIGCLHFERNIMKLCLAVEHANAEGFDFRLSIIGDGEERGDLKIFSQKTENRIRVIPTIPHNQIPVFLSRAHVGVLPFPDEEKFRASSPIKLFEYLASGLPILATRIFCHTSVIGDQPCVIWADGPDEEDLIVALRSTWELKNKLSKMGSHATQIPRNWTWKKSATKLVSSIEPVIERYS